MEFVKLKFVATRWKRTMAEDGETVIFTALPDDGTAPECLTIVEPHWENGQGVLEYHCDDLACEGECVPREHTTPEGEVEVECKCEK